MAGYKILYLPVAEADLIEILEYVSKDRPSAAVSLLDRIDEAVSRLEHLPLSGSVPKDIHLQRLGYRLLVVDKILVFYLVKGKTVEIRRILHGARRYQFLL
ncbi:MAG: type II toxin-antitoxin system RelE/ParE family toxin [Candidatus Xenobiia bacterium LiM19]